MTKLTKLALEQTNATLATENAALRKQVADLEMILKLQHNRTASTPVRTKPDMPQWQVDRAAAMAATKQMAMSMGCVVKV